MDYTNTHIDLILQHTVLQFFLLNFKIFLRIKKFNIGDRKIAPWKGICLACGNPVQKVVQFSALHMVPLVRGDF